MAGEREEYKLRLSIYIKVKGVKGNSGSAFNAYNQLLSFSKSA